MGLARAIAAASKDPSTKVGARIVSGKVVISEGFNGPPAGVDDTGLPRSKKLARTLHAELNAVLFARRDLTGATCYVTHHPCGPCAAVLVQAGIKRVVIPAQVDRDFADRWTESITEARAIFNEAGVTLDELCES